MRFYCKWHRGRPHARPPRTLRRARGDCHSSAHARSPSLSSRALLLCWGCCRCSCCHYCRGCCCLSGHSDSRRRGWPCGCTCNRLWRCPFRCASASSCSDCDLCGFCRRCHSQGSTCSSNGCNRDSWCDHRRSVLIDRGTCHCKRWVCGCHILCCRCKRCSRRGCDGGGVSGSKGCDRSFGEGPSGSGPRQRRETTAQVESDVLHCLRLGPAQVTRALQYGKLPDGLCALVTLVVLIRHATDFLRVVLPKL